MEKEKPAYGGDQSVVYGYSRSQAKEDGFLVDVSKVALEAGLLPPVFITRLVYEQFVVVPEGVEAQDEAGRLWDILTMLGWAIRRDSSDTSRLSFQLYVRNSNDEAPALGTLVAECGPLDFDDPRPALTIMRPDED